MAQPHMHTYTSMYGIATSETGLVYFDTFMGLLSLCDFQSQDFNPLKRLKGQVEGFKSSVNRNIRMLSGDSNGIPNCPIVLFQRS